MIQFKADKVRIKSQTLDGGINVEIRTGEYEADAVKEILTLPEGVYKIQITPDIEEVNG